MKKNIIMAVLFLLISVFNVYTESDYADQPFNFQAPNTIDEIIALHGKPLRKNIYVVGEFNDKEHFLFYNDMIVKVFEDVEYKQYKIAYYINSPGIVLKYGINVGIKIDLVEKYLGKPGHKGKDRIVYYGEEHTLLFLFDKYSQVIQIEWDYYWDWFW